MEVVLEAEPEATIKWYKDEVQITSSERIDIIYEENICTLVISNVKPEDSGDYICEAENLVGKTTCKTTLTVNLPNIETEKPQEETVEEERDVILIESAKPLEVKEIEEIPDISSVEETVETQVDQPREETVEEMKETVMVEKQKPLKVESIVEEVTTSTFEVTDVEEEEPKQETIETQEETITVSVDNVQNVDEEAPRFTQTLQRELVVYEGSSLTLVCFVVGKPTPTVIWFKEEEDITASDRFVSTYDNGRCTLTINNVTVDEEAEFICKAVNDAGSVTTFVDIFVETPEEPESPTPEVVLQPETEVEQPVEQPDQEEITQPQEGLDEVLTVSLIPSEDQPSSQAVTTETILVVDQPITALETEEASTAPEISVVEEVAEIVATEISLQEQPEEETKQDVDLVQAPEDTTISISAFESLIDEIDEKVSDEEALLVLEKPEEAPIESIEETFEFVQAEGEKPVFLQTLQNVEAVEGQQVRFETVVSGEPWPEIVWSLDGEIIRDSPVYRIEAETDGLCRLFLPEAFPEDEGEYECRATNIHGSVSTKADLYVQVLAEREESLSEKEKLVTAEIEKEEMSDEEKKEISPIPVEQPVVEEVAEEYLAPVVKRPLQNISSHDGGQARFEAEIEGIPTPTITWFKDDQVLHPSEEFDIAYSEENVASLYIHDVLPEDAGTYVVQAANEHGTVTSEATLHVDAAEVSDISVEEISGLAPTFTLKPTFQTVDEKETVIFTATIEAIPQPQILWTRDNNPVTAEDERVTTSVIRDDTFYTTTMEVKEATLEDAGTYKVTASNDLGDTSVTVSLIVNKTQDDKTDFRDQLAMAEFEIPDRPEEEEQTDFREVLQTEVKTKVNVKYEVEQVDFRHMLKASKNKAKKFTADVDAEATVTEEAPEAEQVDFRAVLKGPVSVTTPEVEALEFIQPIQDMEVREGESATFECQVKGEPQPQVMWYHDQQPIKSDSVYQITPGEDGKFTLHIPEVFPEDSGVYTAKAFNDNSAVESSATLTVTELASETSSLTSREDKPEEQDIQIDVIQAEAAIKIQSAFRGFKARSEVKLMKETQETSEVTVDISVPTEEDQHYEEEIEISIGKVEKEIVEAMKSVNVEEKVVSVEEEVILESPETKEDIQPVVEEATEISVPESVDVQSLETCEKLPALEPSMLDLSEESVQSSTEEALEDVQESEVHEEVQIVPEEEVLPEKEAGVVPEAPSISTVEELDTVPQVLAPEEQKVQTLDEKPVDESVSDEAVEFDLQTVTQTIQEREAEVVETAEDVNMEVEAITEKHPEENVSDTIEEPAPESVEDAVSRYPTEQVVVGDEVKMEVETVIEVQPEEQAPETSKEVTIESAVDTILQDSLDSAEVEDQVEQVVMVVDEELQEETAAGVVEDVVPEVVEEAMVEAKKDSATVVEKVTQSVLLIADKQKEDGILEETDQIRYEEASETISELSPAIPKLEGESENQVAFTFEDKNEELVNEEEEIPVAEVVEEVIIPTDKEAVKVEEKAKQSVQITVEEGIEETPSETELIVPEIVNESVSEEINDSAQLQEKLESKVPVSSDTQSEEISPIVQSDVPENLEVIHVMPDTDSRLEEIEVELNVQPAEYKVEEDKVSEVAEDLPTEAAEAVAEDFTDSANLEVVPEYEVSAQEDKQEEEAVIAVEDEPTETVEEMVTETKVESAIVKDKIEQAVELIAEKQREEGIIEDTDEVVLEEVELIISEDKAEVPKTDDNLLSEVSVIGEKQRQEDAVEIEEEVPEVIEEAIIEIKAEKIKVEEKVKQSVETVLETQDEDNIVQGDEETGVEVVDETLLETPSEAAQVLDKEVLEVETLLEQQDEEIASPDTEQPAPETVSELVEEEQTETAQLVDKKEMLVQQTSEDLPEESSIAESEATPIETVTETLMETQQDSLDVSNQELLEVGMVAEKHEIESTRETLLDDSPSTVEETILDQLKETASVSDKATMEVSPAQEEDTVEESPEVTGDVIAETVVEAVCDKPSEVVEVKEKVEQEALETVEDHIQEFAPEMQDETKTDMVVEAVDGPVIEEVKIDDEPEIKVEVIEENQPEVATVDEEERTPLKASSTVLDSVADDVAIADKISFETPIIEEGHLEEGHVDTEPLVTETLTESVEDIRADEVIVIHRENVEADTVTEEQHVEEFQDVSEDIDSVIAIEIIQDTPVESVQLDEKVSQEVDTTLLSVADELIAEQPQEESPAKATEISLPDIEVESVSTSVETINVDELHQDLSEPIEYLDDIPEDYSAFEKTVDTLLKDKPTITSEHIQEVPEEVVESEIEIKEEVPEEVVEAEIEIKEEVPEEVAQVSIETKETALITSLEIEPVMDAEVEITEVVQEESEISLPIVEENTESSADFTLCTTEDVHERVSIKDNAEAVEDITVGVEVETTELVTEDVAIDVTFAPQFLSGLKDSEVNEGETLTLEVTVTGAPKPEVKWFQNEEELQPNDHFKLSEVDTTFSLTIADVKEEDDAEYTVTATNTAGKASSSADVIVNLSGEAPSFVSTLSDISVEYNAPIVLEAKVKGKPMPEVTWMFEGQQITDARFRTEYVEDTVRLTIDHSDTVDGGQFTVVLNNKHGRVSSSCHVTVTMVAPVFTKPLNPEVKVKVGSTADLRCEVMAVPTPEVQWFRGDELITDGPLYKIEFNDAAASLRVLDVKAEDKAITFTCKATNPAGEATTITQLLSQAPARILTKPESVTVLEGEPIELTFTLEGSPQPSVEFSVDGTALLPNDKHRTVSQPTDQEVTLTIHEAQPSDSANYTLTVTNEAGSDSASVDVVVTHTVEEEIVPEHDKPEESKPVGEAPQFLLTIKTQTVSPGETADFTCEVTGEPRPHLSWVYNGRSLEDEGRYMILEEEGLHHLEVYEVCPEDVGKYTVIAQNEYGQVDCSAELKLRELPAEKKPELEAPKFIVAIETVEATVGDTATFTGKATGKPIPKLLWYKNDKLIAPEDKQFTVTHPGEGESSLVVVDLRPEHDGTYTCEAKNEAGTAKCKAELFVEEKPQEKAEAPEFIKVPEKVTVREHDNAKFLVKVIGQPKPTVSWLKATEPLLDADLYRVETYEDTHCFEINDTELQDAGSYTCVAENTEGRISVEIPLIVNAIPRDERLSESPLVLKTKEETTPPKFIETFKDTPVVEGEALTLTCCVTGLPRPEITWFRNDSEIEKSPSLVMKHEDEMVKLKIPATKMEQDGLYRCVATNSAGTDSCEARVDVQGKTEAPVFTRPLNHREVREGRPVKFECEVKGIPQPEVSWFLKDQPIETGVHFTLEQRKGLTGDVVHSLSIDVTQVEDAGTVKAVATNKAGEATSEARLDVDEKKEVPKFIKKMETVETVENNSASFTVVVSGKPKPHITWVRGDEELTASDNVIMENEDQTHTLTINKVSLDDAKVFTARAKNPAGQASCNARLKIVPGKKPTFVRKMSDALVPEHGTAKFDCKATGVPAPQVTWSINDKVLEPSDNIIMDFSRKDSVYSLTILEATPDLAGEVKAVATNNGGEVLCTATLDVRGKAPTFVEAPVKCTVLEGYTAEFRCVVDGEPSPTVAWSKGKWMKIQDGGRYTVTSDVSTGEHILQMRDIKNKDAGTYTVTASNEHGSEQVPATLMVTDKVEEVADWKSQLKHREVTEMAEADEEAPWQIDLRHVEVEEQKSPSPEEKEKAPPPEFQRIPWTPFQKRDRPELEEGETLTFEMAPREREELEQFQRASAPLVASAVPEEEQSLGYIRPVKPVEVAESDEQAFLRQKAQWKWTVPLQDQAVKERESAKFQCEFSVPNVRVDWTVAGQIIDSSPKYAIQSDQHTHTLLITKCRPQDATKVSCSFGDITTEANLVVHPVPAEFTMTLEDTAAREGTDAVFTCSTDDDEAPVQWFINGQPISPSDRYRITSDGTDHTLTITGVQPGEDCEVTVSIGDNKSSARLNVQEIDADFLVPLKDQSAKENSTVEFECTLTIPAKPEKVQWIIDGKEVDTSDQSHYKTIVDGDKLRLIIHTVSLEDAGEITVRIGDKASSAKLTVEELEAEFTIPLKDQTVPESSNVEFSCELNIDTDDVAWFLDADKLSPSPKDGIDISKQGLQHRLSIEDVSPEDTGVVKVVAKGKTSEAKLVVEQSGPNFAMSLKDVSVIEKATAEMVCELTKDVDKVRWFIDDIELPEGDRINFLKDGLKHKLIIKDACIEDEGVVSVQVGDKKCSASLFVQELSPEFIRPLKNVSVTEGETATLECELNLEGRTVKWFHEGREVGEKPDSRYQIFTEGRVHRLVVKDTIVPDAGEVMAKVEDKSTHAELTVQELPVDFTAQLSEVHTEEHKMALFCCEVNKDDVTVEWRKDGQPLTPSNKHVISTDGRRHSLAIKDVDQSDVAEYSIIVGDRNSSATLHLDGMFPTGLTDDAPERMRTSSPILGANQSACLDLDHGQVSVPQAPSDDLRLNLQSSNGDYMRSFVSLESSSSDEEFVTAKTVKKQSFDEVLDSDINTLSGMQTGAASRNVETVVGCDDATTEVSDDNFSVNTTGEDWGNEDNYYVSKDVNAINNNTDDVTSFNDSSSSSTIDNKSVNEQVDEGTISFDQSETISLVSEDCSFDPIPRAIVSDIATEHFGRNETSLFDELQAERPCNSSAASVDSYEESDRLSDKDASADVWRAESGKTVVEHENNTMPQTMVSDSASSNKLNLIISPLQPIKSFKNGVAIFVCEVISKRVSVAWQKDGEKVEASAKYVITRAGKMHSLTIHGIQARDEGQYSVICDNDQVSSAMLEVRGVSSS
ncbi:hypothetical protein EGW08_001885 [Elysia chlorotica]|uniref:Ig-like domain-containing protein n=1 Tax=Elysia chlorotica TaxID=188477 RepID=A0A433U9B4_ELYCH|nr:hypothetical protein EGW08_001885 [Elysia chlorotica]